MWIRLDDGFPQHPKIVGLTDAAFRAHVTGICYCGGFLTDGLVPESMALMFARRATINELVRAGLWEPEEGCYRLHDFLDYNPSKADAIAHATAKAKAGAIGAAKRYGRPVDLADAMATAMQRPVPVPNTRIQTTTTSLTPPAFEAFWAAYPKQRRQGKGEARVQYARALRLVSAEVLIAGAERLAADPNLPTDDPRLIPMPATWLHQERWEDGPLPSRSPNGRADIERRAKAERDEESARKQAEAKAIIAAEREGK